MSVARQDGLQHFYFQLPYFFFFGRGLCKTNYEQIGSVDMMAKPIPSIPHIIKIAKAERKEKEKAMEGEKCNQLPEAS